MLIYINADGSFVNVQPSTITQGSNGVQTITVLAEGISQSSSVNISFELPNGQVINGGLMTPQDDVVLNNEVITTWTYTVEKSVTNFPGLLKISMLITDVAGNQLGTYIANVTVTKGLMPVLPSVPTTDWYENILAAYAYITGKISTLDLGKVKQVEVKASDFTLNEETGLYEATIPSVELIFANDGNYIAQGYYDDGTTYRSVGLDFSYNKATFDFTVYAEEAEDYIVVIASRIEAEGKDVLKLTNPASLNIDYSVYGAVQITKTGTDGTYTLNDPEYPTLTYDVFVANSSSSTNDISINGTTLEPGEGVRCTWVGQWTVDTSVTSTDDITDSVDNQPLNSTLNSLKSGVSGNANDIISLGNRMDTAENNISNLQSDTGDLSNSVTSIGNRVTTLEGKMTTAEGNITSLQTAVNSKAGKDIAFSAKRNGTLSVSPNVNTTIAYGNVLFNESQKFTLDDNSAVSLITPTEAHIWTVKAVINVSEATAPSDGDIVLGIYNGTTLIKEETVSVQNNHAFSQVAVGAYITSSTPAINIKISHTFTSSITLSAETGISIQAIDTNKKVSASDNAFDIEFGTRWTKNYANGEMALK